MGERDAAERRGVKKKKEKNTLKWGKWKIFLLLEASGAQSWIWQERWLSIPFLTTLIKPLTLKWTRQREPQKRGSWGLWASQRCRNADRFTWRSRTLGTRWCCEPPQKETASVADKVTEIEFSDEASSRLLFKKRFPKKTCFQADLSEEIPTASVHSAKCNELISHRGTASLCE